MSCSSKANVLNFTRQQSDDFSLLRSPFWGLEENSSTRLEENGSKPQIWGRKRGRRTFKFGETLIWGEEKVGAREREKERRPQPAGETVRERENARTGERERENARKSEMESILQSPFYGRWFRENTVIRYWYLPIPSSGTGSVLEASSTAPELPFIPIPVIQNWMTVSGTGYR